MPDYPDPSPEHVLDQHGRYLQGQAAPEPPVSRDETTMLLGFLERQRATFAWKCGGLAATALATPLAGSHMTLGGMLKHLARFEDDMSTEWLSGRPQVPPWNEIDWDAEHDWDWRSAANDDPDHLYAGWQAAVMRARARFTSTLSEPADARPSDLPSIPYVLVNMIEEYARHNGHADLIRESIDGLTGHDPPG